MSNQDKLANATIGQQSASSYIVNLEGTSETVEVTAWEGNVAYSGAYGTAVLSIPRVGGEEILDMIGDHTSNEYLLSKVATSNMEGDDYRQSLMCNVLRLVAETR